MAAAVGSGLLFALGSSSAAAAPCCGRCPPPLVRLCRLEVVSFVRVSCLPWVAAFREACVLCGFAALGSLACLGFLFGCGRLVASAVAPRQSAAASPLGRPQPPPKEKRINTPSEKLTSSLRNFPNHLFPFKMQSNITHPEHQIVNC